MNWKALLTRRLSFEIPGKFDGEPCTVTVTYSFGRGLSVRINLDEEDGESVLRISKSAIQDARDQLEL